MRLRLPSLMATLILIATITETWDVSASRLYAKVHAARVLG